MTVGRHKALAKCLSALMLAAAVAGCEGNPNDSSQKPKGHAVSFEHELSRPAPPRSADVAKAQQQLAALGYDPGPVDGVMGKNTEIAIKHYQVDAELKVDGRLNAGTLAHLDRRYRDSRATADKSAREKPETADPATASSDMAGPTYEVGDTFVYSDGRVETVLRVGPERTLWKSAEGSIYTAHRNFILPPITWKSGAASGENQLETTAGPNWPPAAAHDVAITVGFTAGDSVHGTVKSWSEKWRCASGEIVPVKTIGGQYDATTIACERSNPEPGTWQKRIWYYVPAVGHYVRRVDIVHGYDRKVVVDLVTVRPGGKGWPPAARGGLDWAIQGVLDSADYDKSVEWRSSAVGARFDIRLTGDVAADGGSACRRFSIERKGLDQGRLFPAIACKSPDAKRWLMPGLDPDAPSPTVLAR